MSAIIIVLCCRLAQQYNDNELIHLFSLRNCCLFKYRGVFFITSVMYIIIIAGKQSNREKGCTFTFKYSYKRVAVCVYLLCGSSNDCVWDLERGMQLHLFEHLARMTETTSQGIFSYQTVILLECFLDAFTLSFFEIRLLPGPPEVHEVTKCY